jgi:sodium/pantothenate symporter
MVREFKSNLSGETMKMLTRLTMGACFVIAISFALFNPPLIQWIIFFSIGGLEAATFGPIFLGLYWRRGTKWGAIASICWGMIIYTLANTVIPKSVLLGTHPFFFSVLSSMLVYVVVSLFTTGPSLDVVQTFWGKRPVAGK